MVAAVALAATALALATAGPRPPAPVPPPPGGPPFRVKAALHMHTGFSGDARGTVDDVVTAAREAGLQVVVITDHNTEAAREQEGWHGGVLVLVGMEKSTTAGHALVLGAPPLPFRLDGDPAEVARDAADLGGFAAVAHPAGEGAARRWSAGLAGYSALEVLSLGERGSWPGGASVLGLLTRYAVDPRAAMVRSYRFSRAALSLWDRLLAERPVAALLGLDAHGGLKVGSRMFPLPSHAQVLRLASEELLLDRALAGDLATDRTAVFDALRHGHGLVEVDALGPPPPLTMKASVGGRSAGPGDEVPFAPGGRLVVDPGRAGVRLVLLKDGRPAAQGPRLDVPLAAPGVYRVEAYPEGAPRGPGDPLPWVITNAIAVLPESDLAARAARGGPGPVPGVPAGERRSLVTPSAGALSPAWQIDRAPAARASARLDDGAVRFDFVLGETAPTHASLALWQPQSFAAGDTLVLRVRGDRRFRFDVQVRTHEPGGAPPVRIWRRSVRAEPEWREAAVPLALLTTYDGRPGPPRLADVVGVYVHVDEAHLPPGARGTLWVADLAVVHPREASR